MSTLLFWWEIWSTLHFLDDSKHTSHTLQWRHNGRDSLSNHQPHDSLLNRWLRRRPEKTQSSASLAFVRGIHRVNSPHKGRVTWKILPFDDVIMIPAGCIWFRNHWEEQILASPMRDSLGRCRALIRDAASTLKIHHYSWCTLFTTKNGASASKNEATKMKKVAHVCYNRGIFSPYDINRLYFVSVPEGNK